MKTAGIVADNYKVPNFELELEKAGFDFYSKPYMPGTTIIKVSFCGIKQQKELALICKKVESFFKTLKQ